MVVEFGEMFSLVLSILMIGLFGVSTAPVSLVTLLISMELLLLSASLSFITFSLYLDDLTGQIFAIFILAIAGAESALGLALLLSYYRLVGDISISTITALKA